MTSGKETVGEQPIFTCKAHVFHIDPKTKRSWLPASTTSINVSFFYDSTRSLYRIISVEGAKAVINSTVTPNMAFTKTSQKFGQWSDLRANTVYGLGFSSESELNKFIDKFQEVKEATRLAPPKPLTNGSVTTPAASTGAGSACSVTPTSAGGLANMPALVSANASPVTTRSVTFSDPGVIEPPNLQPTTPSSAVPSINSEDIVDSKAAQQRSQTFTNSQVDSPKHQHSDTKTPPVPPLPTQASGGQTITSSNTESQLKYENDRLKLALAQSSANAKKWEIELNTLKTNNHRLTSALQESTANVDEWKRQLQSYKEENQKLKNKYIELEASKCGVEGTPELRKELNLLRMKVETLEIELQTKEEDIKRLSSAKNPHEEKCKILMQDNAELQAAISLLQTQLDTAVSAQESQRRVMDTLNSQLAIRIQELIGIHKEMSTALQT